MEGLLNIIDSVIPERAIVEETKNTLLRYGKYFEHFVLAFDILDSEIIKVGIECYYNNKSQPSKEKRWSEVLSSLCKDGYCSKGIMDEILKFPGKFITKELEEFSGLDNTPNFYAQGLHHCKFTIGADKDSYAKVYLWAGYNF